jgi:hypothetical protein
MMAGNAILMSKNMAFKNPSDIKTPDDILELYGKVRPFKNGNVIKKDTMKNAYLWTNDHKLKKDELDEEFEIHSPNFHIEVVYSYHAHSGYYGFFKPDLEEVIKVGQDIIRSHDVVYVTTDTCDSNGIVANSIYDCYDNKLDMHLGKNLFIYKSK